MNHRNALSVMIVIATIVHLIVAVSMHVLTSKCRAAEIMMNVVCVLQVRVTLPVRLLVPTRSLEVFQG